MLRKKKKKNQKKTEEDEEFKRNLRLVKMFRKVAKMVLEEEDE